MPREHHANTRIRGVIGNSIFAVSGWFLKWKKILFAATHSRNALTAYSDSSGFHAERIRRALAFPETTRISKIWVGGRNQSFKNVNNRLDAVDFFDTNPVPTRVPSWVLPSPAPGNQKLLK